MYSLYEFQVVAFTLFKVARIRREIDTVSAWLNIPDLTHLISRFLYRQEQSDSEASSDSDISNHILARPQYHVKVYVYPSAASTYFAPSDKSGLGGMFRERIHSVPTWRNGPARHDCVFVEHSPNLPGFQGLHVAQIRAFLRLKHGKETYPCAVVNWFSTVEDVPCPITGMWKVRRDTDHNGRRILDIVHLNAILRGAHLIGIAGDSFVPKEVDHTNALDVFKSFYVNKYIDYHAHEIAF